MKISILILNSDTCNEFIVTIKTLSDIYISNILEMFIELINKNFLKIKDVFLNYKSKHKSCHYSKTK